MPVWPLTSASCMKAALFLHLVQQSYLSKWKYWRIARETLWHTCNYKSYSPVGWYLHVTRRVTLLFAVQVSIMNKRKRWSTFSLLHSMLTDHLLDTWGTQSVEERISLNVWGMTLTNLLDRWMGSSTAVTFCRTTQKRLPETVKERKTRTRATSERWKWEMRGEEWRNKWEEPEKGRHSHRDGWKKRTEKDRLIIHVNKKLHVLLIV